MANLQDLYLLLSQEPRISEPATYEEFEERMQDPEYNEHISKLANWAGYDVSTYEGVKKKEDFMEESAQQLGQVSEPQNPITGETQEVSTEDQVQSDLPDFLAVPKAMEMPSAPTSVFGAAPKQDVVEEEVDLNQNPDPNNPNNPYDLGTFFHPAASAIQTGNKVRKNFRDKYSLNINSSIDGAKDFIKEENTMAKDMGLPEDEVSEDSMNVDASEDVNMIDDGGKRKRKKKKEENVDGQELPTEGGVKEFENPLPGVEIIGVYTTDQKDKRGRKKYQYIIQDKTTGAKGVGSKPKLMEGVENDAVWKYVINEKPDTKFYDDDSMWQDLNQAVITVADYNGKLDSDYSENLKQHRIKYADKLGFKYNEETGDLETDPTFQYESGANKGTNIIEIKGTKKEDKGKKSIFGKALDWAKEAVGDVKEYFGEKKAINKIEKNLSGANRRMQDNKLIEDAANLLDETKYINNLDEDFSRNLNISQDSKNFITHSKISTKDILLSTETDLINKVKNSGYLNTYFKPQVTEVIEGGVANAAVAGQEQIIDPLTDPERYQERLNQLFDQEAKRVARELKRDARYVLADKYIQAQIEKGVPEYKTEQRDRLRQIYQSRLDEANPFEYEDIVSNDKREEIGWTEAARKSNNYTVNKGDADFASTIYSNSYSDYINRPQAEAFIAGENLAINGVESDGDSLRIRAEYLTNRLNQEKSKDGLADDKQIKNAMSEINTVKVELSDIEKKINSKNEKLSSLIIEEDGEKYYASEEAQEEGEKLVSEIEALTNEYNKVYERIKEPNRLLSQYSSYVNKTGGLYKELENINSRLNELSKDSNIVRLQELNSTLEQIDILDWDKKNVQRIEDENGNLNITQLKTKAQNGELSNFEGYEILKNHEKKGYQDRANDEDFWGFVFDMPYKLMQAGSASGGGLLQTIKYAGGFVETVVSYPSQALGYDVEENWINEDENVWTSADIEKEWFKGTTEYFSKEVVNPAYEKYGAAWWASTVIQLTPDLLAAAGGTAGAVKIGLQSGVKAGVKYAATNATTAYFATRLSGEYMKEAEEAGYSPMQAFAMGGSLGYVVSMMESLFPEIPTFQQITLKRMARQIVSNGIRDGLTSAQIASKISAGFFEITGKSMANILGHVAKEGVVEEGNQFIVEEGFMSAIGARELEIIDPKTGNFGRSLTQYFDNVAIGGLVGGLMSSGSTIKSIFNEKMSDLTRKQTFLAMGRDYDSILENVLNSNKDFKETAAFKELKNIKEEYDKLAASEVFEQYDDVAKGDILDLSLKLQSLIESQNALAKKGVSNVKIDSIISATQKQLNDVLEAADERADQRSKVNEELNNLGVNLFFLNPDGSVRTVLFNSGVKKEEQEARLPKALEIINNNYKFNPQEDAVQESETGQVPVQPEAAVGQQVEKGVSQAEPQVTTEAVEEEVIIDKPAITQNTTEELNRVKSLDLSAEDGATFNIGGDKYEGVGLVIPVISKNTTTEEITPEMIADFVEEHSSKIGDTDVVKFGIYKFPNSNKVSIDLNIVAPASSREQAIEFARLADQESLFDLGTFENIKTGGTGLNPRQFNDAEFKEVARAMREGRLPNIEGFADNKSKVDNIDQITSRRERSSTETETAPETAPQQKVTFDQAVENANQAGFNMSDKTRSRELSDRSTDPKKKRIVEQANNAARTLKSILPDYDIIVFENEKEYDDYQRSINGTTGTSGSFTRSADGNKGVIAINLSNANYRTVSHEMTHALLFKIFGENPAVFEEFKKKISDLAKGELIKGVDKNGKSFTMSFDDFISDLVSNKIYNDSERAEEYLSELVGLITQLDMSSPTTKSILKSIGDFINKIISRYFGNRLKAIDNTSSPEEVMEFLQTFSASVASGSKLRVTPVKEEVKNVDTNGELKTKYALGGDFEATLMPESDLKKLEDDGYLIQNAKIEDLNGEVVISMFPDNKMVGDLSYGTYKKDTEVDGIKYKKGDKRIVLQGNGGLHFALKYNEDGTFWASTPKLSKIFVNLVNKIFDKYPGKPVRVVVFKSTDLKVLSSRDGMAAAMDILELAVQDGDIPLSVFRNALNTAVKEEKDNDGIKLFSGKLSAKELHSIIKDYFISSNDETFKKRVDVGKKIIAEVFKSNEINFSSLSDKLNIPLNKSGKITVDAATKRLGNVQEEGFMENVPSESAVAYIEIPSKLIVEDESNIPAKERKHISYPGVMKTVDGQRVTVHMLSERNNWREILASVNDGDITTSEKLEDNVLLSDLEYGANFAGARNIPYAPVRINTSNKSKSKSQVIITPQEALERYPELKNTKVVDSNGDPLLVYHGGPTFTEFKPSQTKEDKGIYFTDNYDFALFFAHQHELVERDKRNDDYKDVPNELLETGEPFPEQYFKYAKVQEAYLDIQNPTIVDSIDAKSIPDNYEKGKDGFIAKSTGDFGYKGSQYVVFETKQIKNALSSKSQAKSNTLIDQAKLTGEMTEDDQGNYLFYHYSPNKISSIDPKYFGKNTSRTGRDERPGLNISMYYTRPDVLDVSGKYGYVVRVPKDKVYPFNEDPLNLYDAAKAEFDKMYPGQTFDANKQAAFIAQEAAKIGYPMTVAKWGDNLRAETTEKMKGEFYMRPDKEYPSTVEFNPELEKFEANEVLEQNKKSGTVTKSQAKRSDLSKDDSILLDTAIEEAIGRIKSGSGLQFSLNNLIDQVRKIKSVRDKSSFRKKEIEQSVKEEVVKTISREIAGDAKSYMDTQNLTKEKAIEMALSNAINAGIEFSTADEIKADVRKQLDNIIKNTQKQERANQPEITLTTTERDALNQQIKKMASDIKAVVSDMKKSFKEKMKGERDMRKMLSSWVKDYLKSSGISDKLTPAQMRAIVNRALSLNLSMTDKQLSNFIEYVDKIVANQKMASQMDSLKKNRKEALKRKHNQYTQSVKKFLTIPLFGSDGEMLLTPSEMSEYFDVVEMLNQNIPDHSMMDMALADKALENYIDIPEIVTQDDYLDKLNEINDFDINSIEEYREFVKLVNSAVNIVNSLYNNGSIDEVERAEMLDTLYSMEDGLRIYDENHQDQIDNLKREIISNLIQKIPGVDVSGLIGDQKNLWGRFETLMSVSKSEGLMKLDIKDLMKLEEALDRMEYGFMPEADFRDIVNKAEVRYRQMGKAITNQLNGLYGKMKNIVTNLMKRRLFTEESFQWEKVLGIGQESSIYKYLIDPIDRGIRKMNTYVKNNIDKYYEEKKAIRKPKSGFFSFVPKKSIPNKPIKIFGRDILRYTAKVSYDTYYDTRVGVISHILDSGHKAVFFGQKSNDWLGKQLNDPVVRAAYGSDVYILDNIYEDLMSNPNFVTNGKLDYSKIYESYVNDPSSVFSNYENSVYELFRKNVQKAGELIVNANAIRGINGELNPFHSPRKYVGDYKNAAEADLLKGTFGKYGSIRSGSSYTRVLVDPNGPLNFNIDQIVAEQITESARDYYLNDAISFTNAVIQNAKENSTTPVERSVLSAISNSNRKRVDFEISRPEGENILTRAYNNLASAFAKKVLLPPKRLVTELITNVTSGALRQKTLKGFNPLSMIEAKKIMEKFNSPVADMGWRFKTYASMGGSKLNRKSMLGFIENITSSALNIAGPTVFGEWMGNFERHFYQLSGEKYNQAKHLNSPEHQYFIEEAAAYANRQIGKIRGGSLKGQTRMKYKVLPEIFFVKDAVTGELNERKGVVDPNSFLGPIVNFFNNFVYRDVTNFMYGTKEAAIGAVRLDSKKFADGLGSVFGSSYSLSIYPILGYILNQLWNIRFGDDEEKEKAKVALSKFESKEGITSFASDIFVNLAMTLGTSKFGLTGRATAIGALQAMRNSPNFDSKVIDDYLQTFYYVKGVDFNKSDAPDEMMADLLGIISPPISDFTREAVILTQDLISEPKYNRATIADVWEEGGKFFNDKDVVDYKKLLSGLVMLANVNLAMKGEALPMSRALLNVLKDSSEKEQDIVIMSSDDKYNLVAGVLDFEDGKGRLIVQGENKDETELLSNAATESFIRLIEENKNEFKDLDEIRKNKDKYSKDAIREANVIAFSLIQDLAEMAKYEAKIKYNIASNEPKSSFREDMTDDELNKALYKADSIYQDAESKNKFSENFKVEMMKREKAEFFANPPSTIVNGVDIKDIREAYNNIPNTNIGLQRMVRDYFEDLFDYQQGYIMDQPDFAEYFSYNNRSKEITD